MTFRLVQYGFVLAAFALAGTADARERGTPGSKERAAYCWTKFSECIGAGTRSCDKDWPNNAQRATQCYNGVYDACDNAFGGDSTCRTEERVTPDFGPNGSDRPPAEAVDNPPSGSSVAPRTTVPATEAIGPGMSDNTDRAGSDYRSFQLKGRTPGECQMACNKQRTCRAWTYVRPGVQGPNPVCYLKNAVPPARANTCCISGVKGPGVVRDHR